MQKLWFTACFSLEKGFFFFKCSFPFSETLGFDLLGAFSLAPCLGPGDYPSTALAELELCLTHSGFSMAFTGMPYVCDYPRSFGCQVWWVPAPAPGNISPPLRTACFQGLRGKSSCWVFLVGIRGSPPSFLFFFAKDHVNIYDIIHRPYEINSLKMSLMDLLNFESFLCLPWQGQTKCFQGLVQPVSWMLPTPAS